MIGKDSVAKVCDALQKVKSRLNTIADTRQQKIISGQQEVADLKALVKDTESRVAQENTEHQKVINEATAIRNSISIPVKIEE